MAYQKKYFYTFVKLRSTEVHTVEIWHNTEEEIEAEEIQGHMNPFTVEMPELDHKFQVVRGTGCVLNILSDTDMKFFNALYHVNPTDFMVKHYIVDILNGVYYLNAEMITEPYDIDFNYQVSLTGNDGFSLMDRFSFLQSDGTNYEGILSKWSLLQIIFGKIGLPYPEIRVSLSTTFADYSGDVDSTILHESYVNCANFYDEDNKPMSLREVVESILAPYGAYIRMSDSFVYITDIHTLAQGGNITYKRYTNFLGSFSYSGIITIDNEKTISEIGYKGTGTQIEMSGGVNRQVVEYSPYPIKEVLETTLINTTEFGTVPSSYSTKNGFYYKTLVGNESWLISASGTFEQSYYTEESDANIYARWARLTTNTKILEIKDPQFVSLTGSTITPVLARDGVHRGRYRIKFFDGISILIKGQVLVKTKDNPYDDNQTSKKINSVNLNLVVKIGDKYLNQQGNWTTTPAKIFLATFPDDRTVLADRFVAIGDSGNGFKLRVGNTTENITLVGDLEIEVWSEFQTTTNTNINLVTNSTDVQEIWLKDLSVDIVNFDGSEIPDKDISYIGLLDKTFQNEGEKITLNCGTDMYFSDNGKIMSFNGTDYKAIKEWTRNSQTFKIEELLLASLSSNYRSGFVTLSNVKLKNNFSLQNIITDTFIGTKKLMVKSANINYHDDVVECTLVEVTPDELIIVKDPTIY